MPMTMSEKILAAHCHPRGPDRFGDRRIACPDFYRNAFNIGLPILESTQAAAEIREGDDVEVDIETGVIVDRTTQKRYQAKAIPPFMRELLTAGGLVPYVRRQHQQKGGR